MSPSWRDRLLVWLAPAALACVRLQRRSRVLARAHIACDCAPGSEPWRAAAGALVEQAQRLRGERLDVAVVLSNRFVRYALVPSDAGARNEQEEQALARFHFANVYGEPAREWLLRVSPGSPGAPRLASAVDPALVGAIRAAFPRAGKARLVSVQPYLMSAYNCWRAQLERLGAWLLLVESQNACAALYSGGRWSAVQRWRGAHLGPRAWAGVLDREALRCGLENSPRTALVHAPQECESQRDVRGWRFIGLTPPEPGGPGAEGHAVACALTAR